MGLLNFCLLASMFCLFSTSARARIIQRRRPFPTSTNTAAFSSEAAVKQREEDDQRLLPESIPLPTPRAVDDASIVEAANWAINHLKSMSDSGVYESLVLTQILEASTAQGIFHANTFVTVQLSSPHFLRDEEEEETITETRTTTGSSSTTTNNNNNTNASNNTTLSTSIHRLIIMTDLEDGARSFAIDEFPIMNPDAIEEFWEKKVERLRDERELEFRKLEYEYKQWATREEELIAAGVLREGECMDACAERMEAVHSYKWMTDEEFLALEGGGGGVGV